MDLSRKNDGLFILPPFNVGSAAMWGNRIDAIYGNKGFLEQSNQEYVVMSDCNNVLSLDYEAFLMHTKKQRRYNNRRSKGTYAGGYQFHNLL